MPSRADDLPTRYSLLSRLQDWDDQESWKEFFDTYWRLIYSVAIKSGLTDSEAQDVVQETVITVAKGIHTFKRDRKFGSFKGWLQNITRWRIVDQIRKRAPAFDSSHVPDPVDTAPEALWEEEWRTHLYEAAVERVKEKVKDEHYQIFYLYVIKEWPVGRVARAMGVNQGQVYLIKHRIAALIKKEIKALEKKPGGLEE